MGKKKFLQLIKVASQPLPKEVKKSSHVDGYSEKQTLKRKSSGSEAK